MLGLTTCQDYLEFPTPQTIRRIGKSFRRNDFWEFLSGQTLVMIGRWYSRQQLAHH